MKNPEIYSAAIYARLSVDSQNEKNESIQNQLALAKAFLAKQEDMMLCGCYYDLGRTGTNFQREGFNRLMTDVRLGKINCIIVKDFSRFGRNYIETGNYIQKIFPFLGVRFIAVTDQFDSLYAKGDELGVNLKNLANEMYARDIALKVKSAKRIQWEKGSYTGGIPPYGYRIGRVEGKRSLLVEEEAALIVRELYQMYTAGKTMRNLALWLYGEKVHRPKSYRLYGHVYCGQGEELLMWTGETLKAILTNPVYLGHLVQPGDDGTKSRIYTRKELEDGVFPVKKHTHRAVVGEEQFFEAAGRFERQAAHDKGREVPEAVPPGEDIFKGLLFCGECGKSMSRICHIKERGSGGRNRSYGYCCPRAAGAWGCACERKYISLLTLTALLKKAIRREALLSGMSFYELREESREIIQKQRKKWIKEQERIQRQIESRERKESEQYLCYRSGSIDRDEFLHRREGEEGKIGRLKEKLKEAEQKFKKLEEDGKGQSLFWQMLGADDGKLELSRELLTSLVERIRVFPDKRVEITFRFDGSWQEIHLRNTRGDTL